MLEKGTDSDLLLFYDSLTRELGSCQQRTEDGRNNEIVDGKWLDVCFDPDVQDAFMHSKNHQPLHSDFSYVLPAPDFTLMYCVNKAPSGGETVFIDGNELTSIMKNMCPDLYSDIVNKELFFHKIFKNETKKRR